MDRLTKLNVTILKYSYNLKAQRNVGWSLSGVLCDTTELIWLNSVVIFLLVCVVCELKD